MPWKPSDAEDHVKGLTAKQKRAWAQVANSALDRCLADGGSQSECEGTAIRQANAAAQRIGDESVLEAATTKTRAQALLRDLDRLLQDRALATDVREQLTGMRKALKRKWADLNGDAPAATEEAARLQLEAAAILYQDDSLDGRRGLIQQALWAAVLADTIAAGAYSSDLMGYGGCYPYIMDLFDDAVVYHLDGGLYRRDYVLDADGVVLGDPQPVERAYVPRDAAQPMAEQDETAPPAAPVESRTALDSDLVPLLERALAADGTVPIKVIQAGWGSSGYYPAEVLQRDGPRIFTAGLHMFLNHQTAREAAERPEGDLRDLAGVLVTDARWEDGGAAGPGLYADAKVFRPYAELLDEIAPHIGVSIRSWGTARHGEAEGRQGDIIQSLDAADSVDFVTKPGAGGQVLALMESARGQTPAPVREEATPVTPEEMTQLQESVTAAREEAAAARQQAEAATRENERLREAMRFREARELGRAVLAQYHLPTQRSQERALAEALSELPLTEAGTLDSAALQERVRQAAAAELAEFEEAGLGGGRVRDLGGSGGAAPTPEQSQAQFAEAFASFGLSPEQAKIAAAGRN